MKIFKERLSSISGSRWDSGFHHPELVALEQRILQVAKNKLGDFVIDIAGGATPSTKESSNYSDSDNGIPFVRVQNLTIQGSIVTENLRYISKEVHNESLSRSKIQGGDLLIKITGVGRMAIASVAPANFEGNINQHIVRIRTESEKISRILSSYLNLDFVEKIASKRATGGTRPALDYAALLGIPVIFDERICSIMDDANANYISKTKQANDLLESIDGHVLRLIGVDFTPIQTNPLSARMFTRKISDISGSRFDPSAYKDSRLSAEFAMKSGPYSTQPLRKHVLQSASIVNEITADRPYVGLENVSGLNREISPDTEKETISTALKFASGDILFPKLRPYLNKTCLPDFNGICSTEFHVFTPLNINPNYLCAILRTSPVLQITTAIMTGNTLPRLQIDDILQLQVPIAPESIQDEIAETVEALLMEANAIRETAQKEYIQSQKNIESILFQNEPQ